MKQLRTLLIGFLVATTLATSGTFALAKKEPIAPLIPTTPFIYKEKTYDVTIQWINLNDPTLRVDLSLADEKIGATATLESLSKPKKVNETVIASINGSFFNLKPDSQPVSTLLTSGQFRHIGGSGSVVGFDGQNKMHIERLANRIEGAINDQWEPPYSFSPWNINHLFTNTDAIMIFDNSYTGKYPLAPVYAIAVDRNEVIGVYDSIPQIPTHGYIIVTRTTNMKKLVKIGDKISYRIKNFAMSDDRQMGAEITDFNGIRTAVGAGPTLVLDGLKVLNPKAEGFTVSKLLTSTAIRSMVGTTADGRMAMVTTPPMTLDALAELALSLGLRDAINLDGGQSTGMMKNGQYALKPGREISNALVVTQLKEQPYRLKLNDQELFFPVEPYLTSGRTMVPLRRILEMLGCQVAWEDATQSVTVKRYQDTLKFQIGSSQVLVNGRSYQMDVPLTLTQSNSFISVRFLTEFFGGIVTWEAQQKTVGLKLPTVEQYYLEGNAYFKQGDYAKALDFYDKVLKLHPRHVSALKQTAAIYETVFKDLRSAASYYERAVGIFTEDNQTFVKLGNLYGELNANDKAIAAFEKAKAIHPSYEDAYYGLARAYLKSDPALARINYQWLKDHSKNLFYVTEAKFYIDGI